MRNAITARIVTFIMFVQTRKPLVEKKRRARINESLQELRTLLADTDVSTHVHGAACSPVLAHL